MDRANASKFPSDSFTEEEEDKMLFIFDLNSIATDRFVVDGPLRLDIFVDLVKTFKVIGLSSQDFHYIPRENLIICNSKALTIEYINSLKEQVKVQYTALNVKKMYEFKSVITHKDVIETEIEFMTTYNVEPYLLCSTLIDYDDKTITIKSRSGSVKRTINYYAAKLIESCVYIKDGSNKVTNNLVKYPYRELIKELYQTDFISRTIAINVPKEEDINKVDFANMEFNKYPISDTDFVAADTLNKVIEDSFDKSEDGGYVEVIDKITDDQIREFFEDPDIFNESKVSTVCDVNPINYNQTEAALKVAEALINESKAVNNIFSINDYAPPFTSNLYNNNPTIKDKVEEFLIPIPENVDELLNETRAYHALQKIREAKALSKQDV